MIYMIHIMLVLSGAYSTFVISKAGDVAAWGLNNSCQLAINKGDEQNNLVWEPTKVRQQLLRLCVWGLNN